MINHPRIKIVTVCGDPGGAKALIPVIKKLEADNNQLINFGYNEAIDCLTHADVSFNSLSKMFHKNSIKNLYEEIQPTLVLTGTSYNGLNWEKNFIQEAKERKIFSMAVLDYWSNYLPRFSDEQENLNYLPDKIAVMDDFARLEMLKLGFPDEIILVTGQPAFDSLEQNRKKFSLEKKHQVRNVLGVNDDMFFLVFVSQPLKKLYGDDNNPGYLGFDEDVVLKNLIDALERINQSRKRIFLLIRPHPREEEAYYEKYCSNKIIIKVSKTGNGREYMMSADLVLGMNSILLVEACYLDCKVISIQPGLCKSDPLITNKSRESIAIYDEKDIFQTINQYFLDNNLEKRNIKKINRNAAEKIVGYLYKRVAFSF